MKILFFIDSFPAGGKERRLLELMKGLKTRTDIEFGLVIMSKDIHYKEIFDLSIEIYQVIRKTKKDFSVFFKFFKLCQKFKPDIVHCWDSMTAVYLVPITKLLSIKLVNGMIVDAPQIRNFRNKTWLRAKLTFPFSNIIIGNSKAGLAAYGAPSKRSICIYNGFGFNRIERLKDNDLIREELNIKTKFVVGMVASFSIFKDYETYYRAAKLLLSTRNDVTFLAIGDDTDSSVSKNLITDQFIGNFRLLGRRSNVECFVNSMDVCVLSTFTEGISNSILEYMALGKPVIATFGGGTNEIVEDRKTGFLVNPSNPQDLADKIQVLLNDAELRYKMGLSGKERVREYFSINKMIDEFVYSYYKLKTKQGK